MELKQFLNSSSLNNVLHRRYIYVLKQLRKKLHACILIVTQADKGKTIVIIDVNMYQKKVSNFVADNQFLTLPKDLTGMYQKQFTSSPSIGGITVFVIHFHKLFVHLLVLVTTSDCSMHGYGSFKKEICVFGNIWESLIKWEMKVLSRDAL
jgi:hypothetical protein